MMGHTSYVFPAQAGVILFHMEKLSRNRGIPRACKVFMQCTLLLGTKNLDFFDVMVLLIKRDETSGLYRSFFLGRTMAYLFLDK